MHGASVYRKAALTSASPQQIEHDLLIRLARELEEADLANLPALHQVLWRNIQLWGAFASDCAATDNALPADLKGNIVSLAAWVFSHSSKVGRGEASIAPLVDVNRTVAAGLAESLRTAARAAAAREPGAAPGAPGTLAIG